MIWPAEFQQQILSCPDDGFAGRCMVGKDGPLLDVMAIFTDIGDDVVFVEVEDPRYGVLKPCGFFARGQKIFLPMPSSVVLEKGPLHLGKNLVEVYKERVVETFFQVVRIAFHEDGSLDDEEIPITVARVPAGNIEEYLIMAAAGVLFQNEDTSFEEYLEKILSSPGKWFPEVETVLNKVNMNLNLLAKCELLTGVKREAIFGQMRRILFDFENNRIIRSLCCLSDVRSDALARLKSNQAHSKETIALIDAIAKGNLKYNIKVQAQKRGQGCIEEIFQKEDFLCRLSPLGVVGNLPSIKGRDPAPPPVYYWDEIAHIKQGNTFLYRRKEVV